MKTRYRHIFFKLCGDDLWHCFSTHDTGLELGFVEYYQQWKQFQFVPNIDTAFTPDCLQDIVHFMGQLKP